MLFQQLLPVLLLSKCFCRPWGGESFLGPGGCEREGAGAPELCLANKQRSQLKAVQPGVLLINLVTSPNTAGFCVCGLWAQEGGPVLVQAAACFRAGPGRAFPPGHPEGPARGAPALVPPPRRFWSTPGSSCSPLRQYFDST